MDRERKDELPQMQVGFIDLICLPLYKVKFSLGLYLLASSVYSCFNGDARWETDSTYSCKY